MKLKYITFLLFTFILFFPGYKVNSQMYEFGPQGGNRCLMGLNGGTANHVAVPTNSDFFLNVEGTIEGWIYPFDTMNYGYDNVILCKGWGDNSYEIIQEGSTLLFSIYRYGCVGSSVISPNTWTHFAVVFYGGPWHYTSDFYINGHFCNTSYDVVTMHSNTDPLLFGSDGGYIEYHHPFNGYIDEIRIWNRAKSSLEVCRDRFTGIGDGGNANTNHNITTAQEYTGLVSSYTFDYNSSNVFDDISNHTGQYHGAAYSGGVVPGQPIPYNLALYCYGSTISYIQLPDNAIWNNSFGTFESWLYLDTNVREQTIIQKGSGSAESFRFYADINRKLCFKVGSTNYVSTGNAIPLKKWCHVAVTYRLQTGPNIIFYLNGNVNSSLSISTTTMPANSSLVRVGNGSDGLTGVGGYLDEVRFWGNYRAADSIKKYMFVSSKSISNQWLKAAYPFEGNLMNYSGVSGLDGTFDLGLTDKSQCRFSAYKNETQSGPIDGSYEAHPTNLNYYTSPNPFPNGFYLGESNKWGAEF